MRQTTLSPARFGLFLFAFTSLVAADSATQSARPDTLRSVVDEALRSNPELGAIRFNRLAIDEELTAARGLGLPTVDAKSNIGRRRDSVRTATGIKTTDEWHGSRDISLIMSQRIFDGFEYKHEVWRQENRVESARWRVADTANSIALRTVQAYFEVQRAKAVLAAARSNYSTLRALRSRVMSRVNAGLGDSGEATEAGSRLANAQALVIEARGRLADARALFQAVVGRGPGRLKDAPIPRRALPKNVSAAVYHARSAAPSIIATQHDTTAAEAAVGAAYSRLYPRMNLEVSSNHGKGIDEDKDRHIEHRAMLVVRWNLFNGGIDTARIREARARAQERPARSQRTPAGSSNARREYPGTRWSRRGDGCRRCSAVSISFGRRAQPIPRNSIPAPVVCSICSMRRARSSSRRPRCGLRSLFSDSTHIGFSPRWGALSGR
jgi:adhesin transport system outer membrane protein